MGLGRLRLMLAAVVVAVVPLAGAAALYSVSRWSAAPGDALVGLLSLILLLVVLLTLWLSRRVVSSAEALDVSRMELRRLYESARADSLVDALTGLGNHRGFQEEFERQIGHSRRRGWPFALVLIDLDEFKRVNDTAGHAVGDELLSHVGWLIRRAIRQNDHAFRIGGDEFALLLPGSDERDAYSVARRLLSRVLQPSDARRMDDPFSFSAGVSASPSLGTSRSELYAQADAALYWCKRHGRSAVAIYDAAQHGRVGQGSAGELSAAIAAVAQRRALRPVYQPMVDLSSGRVIGYEGLVRPESDTGFSDPGTLFAAAESVGRTLEIDEAALETVIRGALPLPKGCFLSVNLSPRTLESAGFTIGRLLRLLERWGMQTNQLIIEVTERQGIEDIELLRRRVEACREAGIRVAADDVGAGNAGLRLLSEIQFDVVKVDLSLVQDGALRPASLDVLRSIAALAGRWEALLVAEGVETQEQLEMVRALHMDAAQGYLLGRPTESMDVHRVDLDGLLTNEYWVKDLRRTAGLPRVASRPH
jgi:diguanylate cyclase (GGDEF)-like protein